MKKKFFILGAIAVFSGLVFAKQLWRGKLMKTSDVCTKWGTTAFDAKIFKNGNIETRASMACSLLKNPAPLLGKDISEIRSLLGDHDGYYFSDMYPAYMIQVGKNQSEESWQIVFMINKKESIKEIVVHKNCCN